MVMDGAFFERHGEKFSLGSYAGPRSLVVNVVHPAFQFNVAVVRSDGAVTACAPTDGAE
eukprot:SAG11_NODE_10331_length_839_cov_1.045946_1_plen_59_part_00